MKNLYKYGSMICVAAALYGCGSADDTQDTPAISSSPAASSTVVPVSILNGYVANALVWIDFDNNGAIDGAEPYAYSDGQGFVSYNPNTQTDYCNSSSSVDQQFCLKTGIASGMLRVKAAKGIEVMTGEAFRSVLTTQIGAEVANSRYSELQGLGQRPQGDASDWLTQVDSSTVKLSPLTSVNYYLGDQQDLVEVLRENNVNLPINATTEQVLAYDYIARLPSNEAFAASLFELEVSIGRIADLLSVNMDKSTENFDLGTDGLPISNADLVYKAIAQVLINRDFGQSIESKQAGEQTQAIIEQLSGLIQSQSQNDVLAVLRRGLEKSVENEVLQSSIDALQDLVENHFSQATDPQSLYSAQQLATMALLTKPIVEQSQRESEALLALLDVLKEADNALVEKLEQASETQLQQSGQNETPSVSHDLAGLMQALVDGVQQQDQGATEQVVAQTDVQPLADVSEQAFSFMGKQLSLSGIQDDSEYGQVVTFFEGGAQASSGELVMCIAYKNPQDPSDDIVGERFVGSWSEVGSETRLSLVAEGISVQMKLIGEIDGAQIPANEQLPQFEKLLGENYGVYGFRLNEDSATWYSDFASVNQSYGLQETESVPQDDEACRSLLSI